MADDISIQPISFQSQGVRCAGRLFRGPAASESALVPAVVLATGFSGTMDWILPDYAEAFARAGFIALTFDYHGFGESDGDQRQVVNVESQHADIVAALALARSLPGVDPDRIALWGLSLGGGYVVAVASETPGIAAVIAQAPMIDYIEGRGSYKIPPLEYAKDLVAAAHDTVCEYLHLAPYYIKVFGGHGDLACFTGAEFERLLPGLQQSSPSWRNQVAARILMHPPRYKEGAAERITVPILFPLADHDELVSNSFAISVASRCPRAEVLHYPCTHFTFHDPPVRDQAIADQIDFLRRHLGLIPAPVRPHPPSTSGTEIHQNT